MTLSRKRELLVAVLLAAVMAVAFQGSRGLWAPDEGRYAHAAQAMLERGDWLVPRLHGHVYLDKPPVHYWSVASGMALFGQNRWGARLPQAFWFFATALVVGATARRISGTSTRGRPGVRALALYSVSLLPVVAANVITPDTPLAFASTSALYAYWCYFTAQERGERWTSALLLGAAFALGAWIKGPAILLFGPPIALHLLWHRGVRAWFAPPLLGGAVLAALLGGAWTLYIVRELPGAADYLFHNQVSGRLWQDDYARNEEWWEGLRRYFPVLLAGLLPGCLFWPAAMAGARRREGVFAWWRQEATSLLLLWVALPLTALLAASSKLELYVLPLAAPLVIATVLATPSLHRDPAATARRLRWAIVGAALFLLIVKAGSHFLVNERDTTALAAALEEGGFGPDTQIVLYGEKRPGLSLYGYRDLTWTDRIVRHPYFEPHPLLDEELPAILERCRPERPLVFVHGWEKPHDLLPIGDLLSCHAEAAHDDDVELLVCHCSS